jgi:hypothetical protein
VVRPVPLIVTLLPPAVGPEVGLTEVTAGGAAAGVTVAAGDEGSLVKWVVPSDAVLVAVTVTS